MYISTEMSTNHFLENQTRLYVFNASMQETEASRFL